MNEPKLRVLDLFSGVGGFSLGLHWTGGFETVAFCEQKPHAQAVLAKNFPGVPCHDDVTTYDFKEGEADVITAGFPCQDISFAGDGAGLSGARSGLYREVIRALRVVRPKWAVLENVAALLSRGLDTVLGDMATVGYDAEWHCIPASAVGAPHRRDRIWIVAHPGGEQHEGGGAPLSGTLTEELSGAYSRNTGASPWHDKQADTQHPNADSLRPHRKGVNLEGGIEFRDEQVGEPGSLGKNVADTERVRQPGSRQPIFPGNPAPHGEGEASDAFHGRIGGQWATEPDVGRVAHGVPSRVDRLAELGNAVVPAIPQILGNAILSSRRAA